MVFILVSRISFLGRGGDSMVAAGTRVQGPKREARLEI